MPHEMLHTGRVKNQITVRGLDAEIETHVRELARRLHISLNRAAVMLMRKGAGLREDDNGPEVVGASLDSFVGNWSREDEATLLDSIRQLGQIDPDLWK
jgi:hypothetical protein